MTTGRQYHTQQVHYLRKVVNYNTTNIASGVFVGKLPAGAVIMDAQCVVTTAFNAGTTNVLTVGTNSTSYNDIFASADITEGSTGSQKAPVAGQLSLSAVTDVYAKYTQTGTAATAGSAIIVISYVPNNDG